MQTLKQYLLLEKAKTETKSSYELLLPYKDREDIFITFTEINKVGINPRSPYNTPNGIYTYPLKEFWVKYKVDRTKSLRDSAPYAGEYPYIQVLQLVDVSHFINDLKTDYKKDDYERDIEKLKDVYITEKFLNGDFKEFLDIFCKTYNDENCNKVKKMGIFEFMKYIDEQLEIDIKVIFEDSSEIDEKIGKRIKELVRKNVNVFDLAHAIIHADRLAKYPHYYGGLLWFVLFIMSRINDEIFFERRNDIFGNYTSNQRWNNMMRYLGYDGVADRSGVGIIHENEPVQAVFFSIKPIKHIDTIINKDRNILNNFNLNKLYEICNNGDINYYKIDINQLRTVFKKVQKNESQITKFKKVVDCIYDLKIMNVMELLYYVLNIKDIDFNKDFFNKHNYEKSLDVIDVAMEADNIEFFKYVYNGEDYENTKRKCIIYGSIDILKEILKYSNKKLTVIDLINAIRSRNINMFKFIESNVNNIDDDFYYDLIDYSLFNKKTMDIFNYIIDKIEYDEKKIYSLMKRLIDKKIYYGYIEHIINRFDLANKNVKMIEKLYRYIPNDDIDNYVTKQYLKKVISK